AGQAAADVSSWPSGVWFAGSAVIGGAISRVNRANSSGEFHSRESSICCTSTSEKPPPSRTDEIASGVGRDSGPGVPGGGGDLSRRVRIVRIGRPSIGTRSGGPHELIANRAP